MSFSTKFKLQSETYFNAYLNIPNIWKFYISHTFSTQHGVYCVNVFDSVEISLHQHGILQTSYNLKYQNKNCL